MQKTYLGRWTTTCHTNQPQHMQKKCKNHAKLNLQVSPTYPNLKKKYIGKDTIPRTLRRDRFNAHQTPPFQWPHRTGEYLNTGYLNKTAPPTSQAHPKNPKISLETQIETQTFKFSIFFDEFPCISSSVVVHSLSMFVCLHFA